MAHDSVVAAFDHQRRRMHAGRYFPTPPKDNTLHIKQVAKTDVFVRQWIHAPARHELRIARTFLQTFAYKTDNWLAMSQGEVRHQAHTLKTHKLAEIQIQSQC